MPEQKKRDWAQYRAPGVHEPDNLSEWESPRGKKDGVVELNNKINQLIA